jgi:nucleoside-diphosphate-sugar epimerase
MINKQVAILGATGFIGKAVTTLFQKKEIDISACSKNGGNIDSLTVDIVDVIKEGELSKWLKNKEINTLIYLSSEIPKSFQEANWELFHNNLIMHKNVMNCWKEYKFHLIYASGSSVYGSNSPLPWQENSPTFPDNYYTLSKMAGENLFWLEYQNGFQLTILRISAPYGMSLRRKTVVNIFLEEALKNNDLKLFGKGDRQQDFIYIKDIARSFLITDKNKKYGIFNIASGKTVTMRELANTVINQTESSSKIIYIDQEDSQEGFQVNIDISKAKNELGFSPDFSLEEGLKDCILQHSEVRL